MFTKKLKYFEFGIHSEKGKVKASNFDGYAAFESLNGYVFVLCDGNDELGERARDIALDRIRYFMGNEYIVDPFEAVQSALIYTGGYIYKHVRQEDDIYKDMKVSCVCVLIRENKIYYSSLGNCHIYLYTGKGLYRLTKEALFDEQHGKSDDISAPGLLGNDKVAAPFVCQQPVVPVNGDVLLLCTDGLYEHVSHKNIKKILSDPMPVHTKTSRLADIANEAGGRDNATIQIISFYNLEHNVREFIPAKESEKKDKPEIAEINFTGKPVWNIVIIAALFIMAAYMFYDMFLFNPRPTIDHKSHEGTPAYDTMPELKPAPVRENDRTVNYKAILNFFAPADTTYLVQSGDTWGSIYRRFEVCSWFIRNHKENAGKFDGKGDPVAGRTIAIPLIYSANSQYNPRFYNEFTTDKVGSACQHAGEQFIEEFYETLKKRYLKQQ